VFILNIKNGLLPTSTGSTVNDTPSSSHLMYSQLNGVGDIEGNTEGAGGLGNGGAEGSTGGIGFGLGGATGGGGCKVGGTINFSDSIVFSKVKQSSASAKSQS